MDAAAGAQAAAAVLARALGLGGSGADLLDGFQPLVSDAPLSAWAIEVMANGQPVAFLLHAYDLHGTGDAVVAGAERMTDDIRVMTEAAALGTPGPRLVAEARVGGWGVVVAAAPGTIELLRGESTAPPPDASGRPASPEDRGRAADALLAALRVADNRAAAFLHALGDGAAPPTTAELALALFVADGSQLANLSAALRRAVEQRGQDQRSGSDSPR